MKRLLPVLLLLSASFPVFAQSETVNGRFEVVLMSLSESRNVDAMLLKFHDSGYDVQIHEVNVNGTYFSRLTLDGFENIQTARAAAEQMKHTLDNDSIWVNKL